ERGFGPLADIFRHLRDVRLWSVEDRLFETGIVEYWGEAAAADDATPVPFSIQLWYRDARELRGQSYERIRDIVTSSGGRLSAPSEISEIRYYAVVAVLPARQVRRLASREDVDLLGESAIMFFRPTGQSVVPVPENVTLQEPEAGLPQEQPSGSP